MVRAKNYETASTSVKAMQKKTVASFFPDTMYMYTVSQKKEATKLLAITF